MSKTRLGIVVAILVTTGGWLVIANTTERQTLSPPNQNKETKSTPAPNFNLADYTGKTVTLADFGSKPLVINAWASWCPFCNQELVDFSTIQQEFKDQVVIIAINRAEPAKRAQQLLKELQISQTLVYLDDPTDSFYQSIGGFAMPETILVNRQGEIIFHQRGPMDLDEIRQRVQDLI